MITVVRDEERQHHGRGKQQGWLTFPTGEGASSPGGFGCLELLNEDRLSPGAGIPHQPQYEAEILTFVREGAVAYDDSLGHSGVIHAGEFHRMTATRAVRHTGVNASRTECAHVFQLWVRPSPVRTEPAHEQKRFSTAERRGGLRLVAAPDGRRGSLRVQADALLYSALLDLGQHVVHELPLRRNAWLHLVQGEVTLGDLVLTAGDGAGVTAERAVSLTARKDTEILLLDLGEPPVSSPHNGAPK